MSLNPARTVVDARGEDSHGTLAAAMLKPCSTFEARINAGPSSDRKPEPGRREDSAPAVLIGSDPGVVDDFPDRIPLSERELDVIETYLGRLLDDMLE